ncbi:MAG TPA: urease accessory protein UreE [Opitutaceae bacterium]|jgi:urease accessory protein
MELISRALSTSDPALPEVPIRADRRTLAKRLWRAVAADGRPFGIQVEAALRDGDTIWQSANARYVIRQAPEPVLEVALPPTPEAAAAVAWTIGNLHFPIEVRGQRLFAPDDPALRQSLQRAEIPFTAIDHPFRPGTFASRAAPHSHGHDPAHGHEHGHGHGHHHHH